MLDYKLLEAFAAIVEEGGFEKAARRLHITQSAVSQRIKQLEEQQGQILLQRTTPPQATDSGIALLRHYRQVRHLEDGLHADDQAPSANRFHSLSLGINADTLATWFLPAIQAFLLEERTVLDLHIDDQDQTHRLLQEGKVWGCITTRKTPMQGCRLNFLGTMHYRLFCSPSFAKIWFPDGFSLRSASQAPIVRFNRQDGLNDQIFQQLFHSISSDLPTFFVPSSEMFVQFVKEGFCYGLLPDQQSRMFLEQGRLIDLAPDHCVEVQLYWHCWNLRSALLERFSQRLTQEVKRLLAP